MYIFILHLYILLFYYYLCNYINCIIMNLRVKEICREQGLMLRDLAEKINITEVGLSKSLNGNPTIGRLEEIAKALNVEFIELFQPIDSKTKGYIEHEGNIYKIESITDIESILKKIKEVN